MSPFDPTISKRVRRRKLADRAVEQTRWFVNFRDPDTGQRKLPSFETKREAEAFRAELMNSVHAGIYVDPTKAPTVAEAVDHWMRNRKSEVKASTLYGYRVVAKTITGPLLEGTAEERAKFAITGKLPRRDARLLQMLGPVSTADLTTAEIRNWHKTVLEQVGRYTANRALSMLKSVMALCEEDFRVRSPAMPTNVVRRRSKPKKVILTGEQVGQLIAAAKLDPHNGIYYAFPFLAGTRISEQLGLLWDNVDFPANLIRISTIQERDGSLTETTKTEAGLREVPMAPSLRELLLAWRLVCPRQDGKLVRVFPGPGRLQPWPLPRKDGGGPLLYQNIFRLEPDRGVDDLRNWIEKAPPEDRADRAVATLAAFSGSYDGHGLPLGGVKLADLEQILRLAFDYVQPKDDAVHDGVYEQGKREHAERTRDAVLSELLSRPGEAPFAVMMRVAHSPIFAAFSARFRELARTKAERDSEISAWLPADIIAFERRHLMPVKTGDDLYRLVRALLREIDDRLRIDDASSQSVLKRAQDEGEVRDWLMERLNDLGKDRLHAFREAQIAKRHRPDITIASASSSAQLAIEMKHAGRGWTLAELEHALRIQLAESYLKPGNRRHGILVVSLHKSRRWKTREKSWLTFGELIARLSAMGAKITENTTGPVDVTCLGLNSSTPPSARLGIARNSGAP